MSDKPPPPRPDSQTRLKKALSGISSSEMKAVRETVQEEISQLNEDPPQDPPDLSPPSSGRVSDSDIEDLSKAGKIADNFMVGMDGIADVLMLLVMKFGRASSLVRAVFIGIVVCCVLLGLNVFLSWHVSNVQSDMQKEQAKITGQQKDVLSRLLKVETAAGEATKKAAAAEKTAIEARASAPEVVVDDRGRPRLILKVQGDEKDDEPEDDGEPKEAKKKDIKARKSNLKGESLEVPIKF